MIKKVIISMILLPLLANVTYFAAVNHITRVGGFESKLVNYGVSSETEDWWTMFRHDSNHTGYSSSEVPTQLEEIWINSTNTVNGTVRSSPAIVGDKVFVGSSDKRVYVLNATTGEHIMNCTTDGPIESSPAVVDNRVFVGSMNGTVYALRADDLSEIWSYSIGSAVKSSPTVADGMVFLGSDDGYVYALDATSDHAHEIWKFRTACPVNSTPAVSLSLGRVFIGASDGRVYALNMEGRYEWHFPTGHSVESSPTVADGKLIVGSDNGTIYALNATTGLKIWKSNSTGGPVKSSPAVAYGRVFVGSMNGSVYALNETTGNILWNFPTKDFVYSSPAVADGKVFVGSGDNTTYVLNATTGVEIRNFTTGGAIYSSPAIAKNMVFIGSDDTTVRAFGPENEPPVAQIEVEPMESFILQTVAFNGSKSDDPDGEIVSYFWDFGDGTNSTDVAVEHVYRVAGNYSVNLTVTDNYPIASLRKSDSALKSVKVHEAWPMYRRDWNRAGNSPSLSPVTNRTLWTLKIDSDVTTEWMYSSPTIIDGVVYVGAYNGKVYAVNAANGSEIWAEPLGSGHIYSSPAVADGVVYIGSGDGFVHALNASNGDQMWTSPDTNGPIESSPVVAYGRVFIGGQKGVFAFDKDSGDQIWNYPTGGVIDSSPAVANGKVYIGSWDRHLYALDARKDIPDVVDQSYLLSGRIRSSPAVVNDTVFVGTWNGEIYALNASNLEQTLWSYQTGSQVYSSLAVASGMVFVGSNDTYIYALNETTSASKRVIWKEPIGPIGWSSPVVADYKVFVGSKDGKIYALDKKEGTELWSYQTGGPVDSSPAVLNDTLYVTSKEGTLFAFFNKTHDVAVTEVIPRRNERIGVAQNATVALTVTVENQGSFSETNINVTVYYYSNSTDMSVAVSNVTDILLRHEKESIELIWNTTGVAEGDYIISANATLTTDKDRADNYLVGGNVTIGGKQDINVTKAWLGYHEENNPEHFVKTVVGQDCSAIIYITVKNEGDLNETNIRITAYWSIDSLPNQTIDTCFIHELLVNETRTASILWNISATGVPLSKGNYTISVYAWPLGGETETDRADNNSTGGLIRIAMTGDINGPRLHWPDGKCNMYDVGLVGSKFGGSYPDSGYNANCDLTGETPGVPDGKIDMRDVGMVARHFGETDP